MTQQYKSRQWEVKGNTGFEDLKLSDPKTVDLSQLGPNDILVKFKAASLNYRDVTIPKGLYPFPTVSGVIPASDGSGVVVVVGDRVKEFKVGDRVATLFNQGHQYGPVDPAAMATGIGGTLPGTLREYGIFPETGLVHLPKNLNWEEGATLTCAALTSWNALYGLKPVKTGEYVLVQGTGGVSTFALQFAKATGAYVVATTSSPEKTERLRALGADQVINYKENPAWGEAARALTPDNSGFDHIIEIGGPNTLEQSLKAIKFEGVISLIGFLGGEKKKKNIAILDILEKVCTARGLLVGSRAQMKDMVKAIEVANIKPVLDKEIFKFEEVQKAYQYMWDQKHFGKVVIRIDTKDD